MKYPAIYVLLFITLLAGTAHGQKAATVFGKQETIPDAYTYTADSLAFYISLHHSSEADRLQALYQWMTAHMKYNVYTTFESRNEVYSEEKDVRNTLRTRSGVCRNFSLAFKTVAEKMDIPAFMVEGYVKNEGVLMTDPHAWCCAKVNGQWFLYDVTFGMGGINNNNQFTSNPNMDYCRKTPIQMLQNHMPFDPMWQLIEAPYPYHIYDQSATLPAATASAGFHCNDTIKTYIRQSKAQQQMDICRRIRANGKSNPLVDYYLQLTQSNIKVYKSQEVYDIYKKAIKSFNQATDLYNDFIHYRKAKFQPEWEEEKVNNLLDASSRANNAAYHHLLDLAHAPEEYETAVRNLMDDVKMVTARIEKQREFVNAYYKASPSRRKRFFRD